MATGAQPAQCAEYVAMGALGSRACGRAECIPRIGERGLPACRAWGDCSTLLCPARNELIQLPDWALLQPHGPCAALLAGRRPRCFLAHAVHDNDKGTPREECRLPRQPRVSRLTVSSKRPARER